MMYSNADVNGVEIKFERRTDGHSPSVVMGTYGNLPVYRYRGFEHIILPGHTYICDLKMNYSTMGNFYAIPIEEVIPEPPVEEPPAEPPAAEPEPPAETEEPEEASEEEPEEEYSGVMRISPTELKSPQFTSDRYIVRISPNGRYMTVVPYKGGSNYCRDGVLKIIGLDRLSPFVSEYKCAYSVNGDTVKLIL